jgi:hypothetical protein
LTFDNVLNQTSRTIIKITIDSLNEKETKQFNEHLKALHDLLNLIQNPAGKEAVLDKLTLMESNFRHQTKTKSIQKLYWLKQKQQNSERHQNDKSLGVNEKHKDKKEHKHRRFVKRNLWRKTQDKKKPHRSQQFTITLV